VHRDVKPQNVLQDEYGEPCLTDFGLAVLTQATEKLTQGSAILGTPAYNGRLLAVARSHRDRHTPRGALSLAAVSWVVEVYDLEGSEKPVHLLNGTRGTVVAISFPGADGQVQVAVLYSDSGGSKSHVTVWDFQKTREIHKFELPSKGVRALALSPTGSEVIIEVDGGAGFSRCSLEHWPRFRDLPRSTMSTSDLNIAVPAPVFTRDLVRAAEMNIDSGSVYVWNLAHNELILETKALPNSSLKRVERYHGRFKSKDTELPMYAIAVSPKGELVALSDSFDHKVHLIDVASGADAKSLLRPPQVTRMRFHPGQSRLATGDFEGSVRIWDTETGRPLLELHGHDAPIMSLEFSLDGNTFFSGSWDGTAMVWNATPPL
jgi:hypothetical protein